MSVTKAILFYSTVSKACIPCTKFIQQHNLPIQTIALDTKKIRDLVARAKNFRITAVPTLMVVYDDDDIQLFVGGGKIMDWLNKAISNDEESRIPARKVAPSKDMYAQPPGRRERETYKPPRTTHKSRKARAHTLSSSTMYDEQPNLPKVSSPDDEEEEIQFEGDEGEGTTLDDDSSPPPPQEVTKKRVEIPGASGLMTGVAAVKPRTSASTKKKQKEQLELARESGLEFA